MLFFADAVTCSINNFRKYNFSYLDIFLNFYRKYFMMVIELSGVQFGLKSYAWFQNRTSAQREFDLKSQVWFQTKIARHEVQLPLYYIHFEIAQIQDLVKYFIDAVLSRFEIKFIPFLGEKLEFWKQNLQHDSLCLPFSCNLMGYFKQALKSDWLFCFLV